MKAIAFLLTLVALAGILPCAGAASNNWSLPDTNGETFYLVAEQTERPVLLLFWATWCVPCKKEFHDQRRLFDSYAERGVTVLLVSEDTQRTQAKVKPYVESRGYGWRTLLDPRGEVLRRYGGTSLPYTVLLDGKGRAVLKLRGSLRNTAALTAKIDKLLQAGADE